MRSTPRATSTRSTTRSSPGRLPLCTSTPSASVTREEDGCSRWTGSSRPFGWLREQEIDIVKIDCEGCEIDAFADMMQHPVRQILTEVHGWGSVSQYNMDGLFETMGRNKYVIFHKKPNL
jgi:hypothetical protein